MEYTVTGDPVNLASRVESLNKPLGTDILITEDTWRLVRKKFITEEMPPVTVKGKEKPVRIFAVINYAKSTKGPQSIAKVRKLLGIPTPELFAKTRKGKSAGSRSVVAKTEIYADAKKHTIIGME
jgi:adenylate cyclase